MPYPSRVAWQFRNVTRSYDFWPRLDSISITESNPEDLAVMSGELVDQAGAITMSTEDEVWAKVGGTKAFGGHINVLEHTQDSEVGPRVYRFTAQDYTLKLDDSVIDHPKARGSESLADRVAWVLGFLSYGITTTGVSLPSETSERAEYDGMTVREALDQLSDEHRLSYYVDFDKDLHLFRAEIVSAPFELDDDAPDYAASFPYRDFSDTRDSVELAQRIYVIGEKGRSWVGSGSNERSISDPELVTTLQRQRAGDRAVAEDGTAQVDGRLLCHEPGLRGGMTFLLTNALWGMAAVERIAVSVEMTAVDPHDDDGEAYLHTQVQYSDRRRARPRKHRGARPAVADLEDGASVSLTRNILDVRRDMIDAPGGVRQAKPDTVTWFASSSSTVLMEQGAALRQNPFTDCPGAEYSGQKRVEQWWSFDPGTLVGVAGVRFTYTTSSLNNVTGKRLEYGVAHAVPTGERQYEALGECDPGGGTFVIPASLLEPSATNYVVVAPAWAAPRGCDVCDGALANPSEGTLGGLFPGGGEFNSGSLAFATLTAVSIVLSGSGLTPWASVVGDIDGSNRTYTLPDWNGKGTPIVRIGGVEYAYGQDYTADPDTGTIAMAFAPWEGAPLQARWQT